MDDVQMHWKSTTCTVHGHASINAQFNHHHAPHSQSAFTLQSASLLPDPRVSYLCVPECPPVPWSTDCTLNVNCIHILKLCSGLRIKAGYKREFGLTYSEFYNWLRSFQTLNYYSVSITDEMAAKQKLTEEFDSASNVVLTKSAIIHGVVASALPMKTGKRAKFFEGKLTDGTKMMRMVGFRSHQQNQLATYHADAKPVALHNCELKPARQSQELEVLIKSSTRIESSPKFVTSTTSCRRILL